MVNRLIFHLGDCKTGSTSIQSILAHRSWESPVHTVVYPTQFNHSGLAKSLHIRSVRRFKDKRFKDISLKLRESNADIGVISAEAFEFCNPFLLKDAINEYLPEFQDKVNFVSYVRPHCSRILASFSEQVKKGGFNGSLSEFSHYFVGEKKRTTYAPRCQLWREAFGSRYIVKPMIPHLLYHKDVVLDFLYQCFSDQQFRVTAPTRHNESLTLEDLSILRYMHQKLLTVQDQRLVGQSRLGSHLSVILSQMAGTKKSKLRFHKSLIEEVVDMNKADAEEMDSLFFSDMNNPMQSALELSLTNTCDQEQSLNARHYYSEETIRMVDCWLKFAGRLLAADPVNFVKMAKIPGRNE